MVSTVIFVFTIREVVLVLRSKRFANELKADVERIQKEMGIDDDFIKKYRGIEVKDQKEA